MSNFSNVNSSKKIVLIVLENFHASQKCHEDDESHKKNSYLIKSFLS